MMYVHKLCRDNDCVVYFDESSVYVKDKTMGEVWLRGISKNGVYPLQPHIICLESSSQVYSESSFPAFITSKESGDVWHARLGHTSARDLGNLCSNNLISCTSTFHDDCIH